MSKHLLAPDLVALGWDKSLASAAEDALNDLASLQAPFDAYADTSAMLQLPELSAELEATSATAHFSTSAVSVTASTPVFRTGKRR